MSEKLPSGHPDYHKTYYREHKKEIAAGKKERYQNDPEYRSMLLRISRERRESKRKLRETAKLKAAKKNHMKPVEYSISIGGIEVLIPMYSITQLAAKLGKTAQTIRLWEKKKYLPKASYRSSSGNRLYTDFQVKMIIAALAATLEEKEKLDLTCFSKHTREIWKNYPYGIEE